MSGTFNRGTGLIVIEVRASNPNGDPDAEGEPRTTGADRRGLISPVSFKRKLRDLVADAEGPAFQAASTALGLDRGHNRFGILEVARDPAQVTRRVHHRCQLGIFLGELHEFFGTKAWVRHVPRNFRMTRLDPVELGGGNLRHQRYLSSAASR